MKKIFLSFLLGVFISTNFFGIIGEVYFIDNVFAIGCSELGDNPDGLPCSEDGIKTLEKNENLIDKGVSRKSFKESVMGVVDYFLILLGLLGVVMIIYAGITVVVGGEEKQDDAKKMIFGVIIGFVIIFLSYSIIRFVGDIGGTNDGGDVNLGVESANGGNIAANTGEVLVDENGNPILTPDGKSVYIDENGDKYYIDDNGNKVLVDENGNPILTPDGKPVYIHDNGNKVLVDENGNPILTPDGKPVYIDENGDKYYIDDNGNKVLVDENGNPVLTPDGNFIYLETKVKIFVNGKEVKSVLRVNILDSDVKGVLFDPSKSVVEDGKEIVEYVWEFGDGNKDYYEDSEAVRQFYENAGNYILKLSIKDDNGNVSSKQIRVIVKNLSANIDVNPDDIYLGAKVSFDGSGSKSSDGKISSYEWEIKNSEGKNIKSSEESGFSFIPKKAGFYTAGLIVENLQGKEDYIEKRFLVNSNKPKSVFKFGNNSVSSPGVFIFDGGSSYDIDGDVLKYSWDFNGDGSYEIIKGDSFKVMYSYEETGDYNVYLKVEDQFGEFDIFNQKITVRSVLNVDFDVDRYASQKGGSVNFTPIVPVGVNSILWNFKDGKKETTTGLDKISHTFNESGIYTVQMTAVNRDGEENSIIKKIFIGDGEYPVGIFQTFINGEKRSGKIDMCGEGKDGIEITRLDQIEVNAKDSVNLDNTNGGLSYTWDFGDGNFSETQVARHNYRLIREECYPIKVSVKDSYSKKVAKLSDTIRVRVVNKKPKAGELQLIADKNESGEYETPLKVKLNLNNTFDEDGNIVKYKWYYQRPFTDEKLGYIETFTKNVEFLIEADGVKGLTNDYVFNVEVEDNEGGTSSLKDLNGTSSVNMNKISVKNGETKSLDLDFEVNKTQFVVGDQAIFRVKSALKNDNLIYSWDFNGDEEIDISTQNKIIEHSFDKKGVYEVELRVEINGVFKKVYKTIYVDEEFITNSEKINDDKTGNEKISGSGSEILKQKEGGVNQDEKISTDLGIKLKGEGISLTSLNVRIEKYLNNEYEIITHITNSDASIYNGVVEFQIIKGEGEILIPQVNALNSIAKTRFTKIGNGIVEIRILAGDTIYGKLEEKIVIE